MRLCRWFDAGHVHRIAVALPGVTQREGESGSVRVDDKMLTDLLRAAWQTKAPRKLLAALDG